MGNALKVVFMGTPDFAVPALEALIHSEYELVGVFSQPPRPKGRGYQVQPSPVHNLASEHNIKVYTPKSLKKDESAQVDLALLEPDIIIVAAYGLLLPKRILELPRYGCLNIHASLLPRWRGASPIQHSVWKGDNVSGVTIMKMEEGLDTGPMILKKEVQIRQQTTSKSLHDELSALGAIALMEVLDEIAKSGKFSYQEQDDNLATYAPMLKKEDGRIDWNQNAQEIDQQIRALNPWPGVWSLYDDEKRIKIIEAEAVSESYTEPPGTLIDHIGHVACGDDTAIRLITVQPENAKKMDFISAMNGGYIKRDHLFV
jgi:methionyl-tRNA formyltransferase